MCGLLFFSGFQTAYASSIGEVESAMGIDIVYGGNEQNLNITQVVPGAYEIKASTFVCTPGTPNCEPDRYEIRFNEVVRSIYGLGTLVNEEKVEVSDFVDSAFSMCHYVSSTQGKSSYECDNGRLRTPVLVLPTKGMILAYVQPSVKMLRLTRDGTNGCPVNNTCIVFKKHHLYNEGVPGPLLVIKKPDLMQLYNTYSQVLKTLPEMYFRQPNFKNFGVGWETWGESGCDATKQQLMDIVKKYDDAGVGLSSLTIGSGYYNSDTPDGGCGQPADPNTPAMDVLWANENRFGGLPGLAGLFDYLKSKNIIPMIGMRTLVKLGTYQGMSNPPRIAQFFSEYGITNPYLNNGYEYAYDSAARNKTKLVDPYAGGGSSMTAWLEIVRNGKKSDPGDGYDGFGGFKYDTFVPADQKGYTGDTTVSNLTDNVFSKTNPLAYAKYGNDFLIHTREQWFSPSADANTGIMWARWISYDNYEKFGYLYKFADDKALSEVVSGYPHVRSADSSGIWYCTDANGQIIFDNGIPKRGCRANGIAGLSMIHASQEKEFLRTNQITTFYPVTNVSTGFWRTSNVGYQKAIIFYQRLRNRLQQYAYDQAMRSYNTGVPWEMQPLFVRWYSTNPDAPEYAMYNQVLRTTTDLDQKNPNEFMFGNALLVRPLYTNSNQVNVYLPTGNWRGFIKATGPFTGPTNISYSLGTDTGNVNDFPVFLKEGEILLIADYVDLKKMQAYVFLDNMSQSAVYETYTKVGAKVRLQAVKANGGVVIKNLETNQQVSMGDDQYGKGFKVAEITSLLNGTVTTVPGKLGDANGDGLVNVADFAIWKTEYLTKSGVKSDFDKNGKVTITDFAIWKTEFLKLK